MNPNELGALQLLIQVQRSLGLTAEAAATQDTADRARSRMALMDQLTKTIDQRPDDPEPRYRMGQAAMEGEMNVLAFQCFQAALDIDPSTRPPAQRCERCSRRRNLIPRPCGIPCRDSHPESQHFPPRLAENLGIVSPIPTASFSFRPPAQAV